MYTYLIIFLAIVLESFPISSSGHIALVQRLLKILYLDPDFLLFLNGFTALVLAIFFFKRWEFLVWALLRKRSVIQKIFVLGGITDGITVLFYFLCAKKFSLFPLCVGFLLTSLTLFSLFFCSNAGKGTWNYVSALVLGLVQSLALFPGISRFGITFAVSRWFGMSNRKSFELSFLIEFPIVLGACLLGGYKLYEKHLLWIFFNMPIIAISSLAMIGALLGLWIMRVIISYNYLWLFSFYVMIISLLCMPL